jgi:hypothetical protein
MAFPLGPRIYRFERWAAAKVAVEKMALACVDWLQELPDPGPQPLTAHPCGHRRPASGRARLFIIFFATRDAECYLPGRHQLVMPVSRRFQTASIVISLGVKKLDRKLFHSMTRLLSAKAANREWDGRSGRKIGQEDRAERSVNLPVPGFGMWSPRSIHNLLAVMALVLCPSATFLGPNTEVQKMFSCCPPRQVTIEMPMVEKRRNGPLSIRRLSTRATSPCKPSGDPS